MNNYELSELMTMFTADVKRIDRGFFIVHRETGFYLLHADYLFDICLGQTETHVVNSINKGNLRELLA